MMVLIYILIIYYLISNHSNNLSKLLLWIYYRILFTIKYGSRKSCCTTVYLKVRPAKLWYIMWCDSTMNKYLHKSNIKALK